MVRNDAAVLRIKVPADAKITFGPLQPGSRTPDGYRQGNHLRVYKGALQLMVLPNIREFWDEELCLERMRVDGRGEDASFNWKPVRPEDPMIDHAAELMENKTRKRQACSNCGWID